jgi:hypothetical protein
MKLVYYNSSVYLTPRQKSDVEIFKHIIGGVAEIKDEIIRHESVFKLHGIKVEYPITCEDTGTLWRVSDGEELTKQEDGRYHFNWTLGAEGSQFGYDFDRLNDGYNFTSRKEEI